MPNRPAVSVVIPVFNAAPYLEEALASVFGQTLLPADIIAVDDGSTDGSGEILRAQADGNGRRGLRVLFREHRGVAAALNDGIAAATGEFVAFLDADDHWEPDKLARQADLLACQPGTDACFGWVQPFISPDLPDAVKAGIFCPPEPQPGWLKQTMLVRRAAFVKTGLFDPTYRTGDFIEWFMRAQAAGLTTAMLPAVVTHRRLHRSGLSSRTEHQKDFARMLKTALDRKRQPAIRVTNPPSHEANP